MIKRWYDESIFYHIYPLGLCDAPLINCYRHEPLERLLKIEDWICNIKELGVGALYLGPLFESKSHGYDTVDYFTVDRRLGTNKTLQKLVSLLHLNGIKVVLDGVFNHVSRDFFAFKDLRENRGKSDYIDWFCNISFSLNNCFDDGFSYDCWEGHNSLVKLNLKNSDVKEYLFKAISFWVDEFDIDGIRLDVAEILDFTFMEQLSKITKEKKEDFWLMGEVIHGDYRNWVKPEMLTSTTNYECYKGLYSSFNDLNMFEIAHSLKRLFNTESGIYNNLKLYNFADNHDVERVSSILRNPAHLYPLYIMLFTMPGVPSIYYGSEWGITGKKNNGSDEALRPSLEINEMSSNIHADLKETIINLSNIWNSSNCLKYGTYKEIYVDSKQIVFSREYDKEKYLIFINASDDEVELAIPLEHSSETFIDILNDNSVFHSNNHSLKVGLNSSWGKILKVV